MSHSLRMYALAFTAGSLLAVAAIASCSSTPEVEATDNAAIVLPHYCGYARPIAQDTPSGWTCFIDYNDAGVAQPDNEIIALATPKPAAGCPTVDAGTGSWAPLPASEQGQPSGTKVNPCLTKMNPTCAQAGLPSNCCLYEWNPRSTSGAPDNLPALCDVVGTNLTAVPLCATGSTSCCPLDPFGHPHCAPSGSGCPTCAPCTTCIH